MRLLSETKLAIDDLYERTREQNKRRTINDDSIELGGDGNDGKPGSLSKSVVDARTYIAKLHALQFRVLDLQDIIVYESVEPKKKIIR